MCDMLAISLEKAAFIIIKAREFDVKVESEESEWGASNSADDGMREVLEDGGDDATEEELAGVIDSLDAEEQVNLVALAWLGRGDDTKEGWDDLLQQAWDAHNEHTSGYLLGMPLLADYLEGGLAELGLSIGHVEKAHL